MYFVLVLIIFFSFFSCDKKDISSINDNANNKNNIAVTVSNDNGKNEYDEGEGYVVYAGSGNDPFVKPSFYTSVPIGVIRKDEGILDYGHIMYEGYMEIDYWVEPFVGTGVEIVFENPVNIERKVYYKGEKYGFGEYYIPLDEGELILALKDARGTEYPPQVIWHGENIVEMPLYHTYLIPYSCFYNFETEEDYYFNNVLYMDIEREKIIVGRCFVEQIQVGIKDIFTEIVVFNYLYAESSYNRANRVIDRIYPLNGNKQVVSVNLNNKKVIVYYKDLLDEILSRYDKNAVIKTVEYDYN
jgi:hypothetical protein